MLPEVGAKVLAAHDLHALVLQHRRAPLYAALAAQLLEDWHGALGQQPAVTAEALDMRNTAFVILERLDATALRECMEHPLFCF